MYSRYIRGKRWFGDNASSWVGRYNPMAGENIGGIGKSNDVRRKSSGIYTSTTRIGFRINSG